MERSDFNSDAAPRIDALKACLFLQTVVTQASHLESIEQRENPYSGWGQCVGSQSQSLQIVHDEKTKRENHCSKGKFLIIGWVGLLKTGPFFGPVFFLLVSAVSFEWRSLRNWFRPDETAGGGSGGRRSHWRRSAPAATLANGARRIQGVYYSHAKRFAWCACTFV